MIIATFETEKLNLPKDVQRPSELIIQGEVSGARNEVVVILQLKRAISQNAYVCHEMIGAMGWGIYDLPGFKYLATNQITKKQVDGINFTMACEADANLPRPRSNWLW